MFEDFAQLSLDELSKMINSAQKALDEKRKSERKAVIAQIHALADSIGAKVSIDGSESVTRGSSRKGQKVAPKYQNPSDVSQTWTGRGVQPRWLKALIEMGRKIEEFKI